MGIAMFSRLMSRLNIDKFYSIMNESADEMSFSHRFWSFLREFRRPSSRKLIPSKAVRRKDDALTYFLPSLSFCSFQKCVNKSESSAHCKPIRRSGTERLLEIACDCLNIKDSFAHFECQFLGFYHDRFSSGFSFLSSLCSTCNWVHNEYGNVYQLRASSSSRIPRPCSLCIIPNSLSCANVVDN